MYVYQKTKRYFAQVADNLEELARDEICELGGLDVKATYRGVFFTAEDRDLYRIVYCTRLITRILAPLLSFDCHNTKYLYRMARQIDWTDFMDLQTTFAVSANVGNSKIRHSKYASLCVKDAIVDSFRDATGDRPNVETVEPDVQFNLHILENRATIYVDVSGGSLHRRGYRVSQVEAPMQEILAAAVIAQSGWTGERPLIDPMCGSGTLLAEALMKYCRIPSGYLRERWGFETLPGYDEWVWQAVRREVKDAIRPLPEGLISGSDYDSRAIAAARANLKLLPSGDKVALKQIRFQDIKGIENSTIVVNPPYGMRIGRREQINEFIREFGDFLKQRCKGCEAYVYLGKRELLKEVGLRTSFKRALKNGQLDGRLAKYELF